MALPHRLALPPRMALPPRLVARRALSVGSMFARRAAASEGSHARDDAKLQLKRLREKLAREGKLDAVNPQKTAGQTVDVLAEISAHELPLSVRDTAHLDAATIHDLTVSPPDPSKRLRYKMPSQAAVAAEIYRDSPMTYAGGRGGDGKNWFETLQSAIAPSSMLAVQHEALESKLGRPLREKEVSKMKEDAKASAMASASMLVGSFCCVVGAMFGFVIVWRSYGKPKTAEELSAASELLVKQQAARKEGLREVVGPVVSSIKLKGGAMVTESEGLQHMATGLKQTTAIRVSEK